MWNAGQGESRADAGEDSDIEEANPLAEARCELMGRKGQWANEDLELRAKETFAKKSSSADKVASDGAQSAFPITRKRAAGIRKRGADGDDE